ncbi:MAG: GGDEF domain-containing protein [Candidatus Thiodiazotropha endolucinida]
MLGRAVYTTEVDSPRVSFTRNFMLRLGHKSLVILTSLASIILSVLITVMLIGILRPDNEFTRISIIISIVVPAIVAPVCSYYGYGLLFKLYEAEKRLYILATVDELTSLSNRRYFFQQAHDALLLAQRYGYSMAILMIDVDHFKYINDEYGHMTGDEVLRCLGKRIKELFRETDLTGRFGGEEFICLLPHTTAEQGRAVADKLLQIQRSRPILIKTDHVEIAVSIGIADVKQANGYSIDTLIDCADTALYQAKEEGRDRAVCYRKDQVG